MTDDIVDVDAQADIISGFLTGLLEAIDAEGTVERTKVDDDTIELSVQGDDLGLLIGPKGQTLTAVHELSRTVLQRTATGRHDGRAIDVPAASEIARLRTPGFRAATSFSWAAERPVLVIVMTCPSLRKL